MPVKKWSPVDGALSSWRRGSIRPCSPGTHSFCDSPSCDCFISLGLRHLPCCCLWNHDSHLLSIYCVVFGPLCKLFPTLIIALQGRYCYFILQIREGMFKGVRWLKEVRLHVQWVPAFQIPKPAFVLAAPDSQDGHPIRMRDCIIGQ